MAATRSLASDELARRLAWLLVFRGAIATALLSLTLAADWSDWPLRRISALLYGVSVGSFVIVLLLGLLLRARLSATILSTVYLTAAMVAALACVHGTGGVESLLSFMYVLAILDGAIIGGRRIAVVMGTCAALVYGLQLVLQLYHVLPALGVTATTPEFTSAFVLHLCAFYLVALLSGHLAEQLRRARQAAWDAVSDLKRSEELHAAVLESLPVGVMISDSEGVVQLANRGTQNIFGVPPDELVGAPLPAAVRPFWNSRRNMGQVEMHIAGGVRHVSLRRSPFAGDPAADVLAGQLDVWVMEDRTELHTLEDSLRAKERMASIGQFSAAIAHELRNPLAAISGCVELFRADTPVSRQEQDKLRAIVLREIERLEGLVRDFLCFARPPAPVRMSVDVSSLAQEVCTVLRQDNTWQGHDLAVQAPERLEAAVDPGQFRQMLWNLLRNAVEASPPAAPVQMRIERRQAGQGEQVVVSISDRGPGIAPSIKDRLFEPFSSTKPQGTGLGLAVVRNIVVAHGGEIQVLSQPGEGTTMRVVLPLQSA